MRRTWRLHALDEELAAQWAGQIGLAPAAVGPDGLRLTVSDETEAARILRRAVEAGIDVVSFGPLTGALEETYLAMESERR